jgi:cysteinyl-tRNA synthetase
MSKSLGNVLAVRDLLEHVTPGALKIFLLGTHYRAPVDFSEEALISAGAAEDRFRIVLHEVQRFRDIQSPKADLSRIDPLPLFDRIREAEKEFTDAMDDDCNTPRALAALFNLTRDINVALKDADGVPEQSLVNALGLAGETLRELGSVLGGLFEGVDPVIIVPNAGSLNVSGYSPSLSVDSIQSIVPRVSGDDYCKARDAVELAIASGQSLPTDAIKTIVEYRMQCRETKDWETADAIRTWLADLGVVVDDIAHGARWHLTGPRP